MQHQSDMEDAAIASKQAALRAGEQQHRENMDALVGALNNAAASSSSTQYPIGAQQTSAAMTGSQNSRSGDYTGEHYAGPNSDIVQGLLSRSPTQWSCPRGKTEKPTAAPIKPSDVPCMRDDYAWAALLDAYGAECHSELGMKPEAQQNAADMMTMFKAVKSLCSNAPAVAGGNSCTTLRLISCP